MPKPLEKIHGARSTLHGSLHCNTGNEQYTLEENNEKYLQTHIFTMLLILSMRSIEDIKHYRMKI